MRFQLPIAMALLAFSAPQALAGVVVTSNSIELATHETKPTIIYADTDKLKVISPTNTIIYRGDLKKLWIINEGRKSYLEMTPETMQQFAGQMAGASDRMAAAQAQLQARLATMPPAQRAQMEAMLAGRGGAGGPPPGAPGGQRPSQVVYAKAGANKTVAKIRCDTYHKSIDGAQNEDVCIAPIGSAGLTANDFKVLDSFSSFAQPIVGAPQANRDDYMDWNAMNRAIGFQGFPLDTVHYSDGKASRQDTVQKIERQNIPAGTFELPAGLTQQGIPGRPPR
jgi:hypothetical protein